VKEFEVAAEHIAQKATELMRVKERTSDREQVVTEY
jgi:hypothetical protein